MQSDPIGLEGGMETYGYVGNDVLAWIDPWGLMTIVGCNEARTQQLMNAASRAKRAVEKCVPCGDKTDFRKRFDDMIIHCTRSDEAEDRYGRKIRFCGAANKNDPHIRISPSAFTNPKCGCLQATVIHETSHTLSNPYTDDPADSRNAAALAKRCFPCAP